MKRNDKKMKKQYLKGLILAVNAIVLCMLLVFSASAALGDVNSDDAITASDARLILRISAKLEIVSDDVMQFADINADGKVTSSDARIALRISAKIETIETYLPADVIAEITYSITDNGFFVGGESTATVSVTPDADCSTALVQIVDAAEEVVYTCELSELKKDTASTFEWNGTGSDGVVVASGDYRICVTINDTVFAADGLNFTNTNYFSGATVRKKIPSLYQVLRNLRILYDILRPIINRQVISIMNMLLQN